MADGENLPDIDHGLASLTEETTAAEFLRSKGQHKKVKTINKEKLKQWISQAINQTRAGMADAYNDEEKEELLRKTQEQLEEVMARAAKAEADVAQREQARDSMAQEIEALQARAAEAANVEDKSVELAAAMATVGKLQDQYNNSHKEAEDLRLDVYELQDQLNTKVALLRSTMEEKDRLKETMQGLMVRAGDLTGGVLHLDQEYYAGKHAAESELTEDVELTEQFFHDFEVGAQVIESLSTDLAKLREISESKQEKPEAEAASPSAGLLAADLALLEQLQAGSLSASDVAEPVEGLIEALNGAREEAIALEREATAAMGVPQTAGTVSGLPDAGGDPAAVIAGATAVSRELAALFAKERNRVNALQMMLNEADSARNENEEVAAQAHESYDGLLASIAEQLERAGLNADDSISNEALDDGQRIAAAQQALGALSEQAAKSDAEKFYNALLDNIQQQASEVGVACSAELNGSEEASPSRNAAAAQAVLEMAQKAGDTSVLENYDSLLAQIDEQAELAGIERDADLANADADSGKRLMAATAVLAAVAAQATDDSVEDNYNALLERLAEEAKEHDVAVSDDLVNNEQQLEARQAEAEKVVAALAEKSAASKDIAALQAQLDEALNDVAIATTPEEEPVAEEPQLEEPAIEEPVAETKPASDHSAVKALMADRIATMVGKIKDLEGEKAAAAQREAELQEKIKQLEQSVSEAEAVAEAAKGDKPHEKELAQSLMRAVQGDEELAANDAVLDLALAVDDYNDELAEDEDDKHLLEQCKRVVDEMAQKKHAVMTELAQIKAGQLDRDNRMEEMERQVTEAMQERDEMAESGKEIISQITQQRDAKVKEADEAKAEARAKDNSLNAIEGAVHGFADRLNDLVEDEEGQSEEVAAAKNEARDALAQMPGEKSIPLKPEVAQRVCVAGVELIDALSRDGGAKAKSLQEELAIAAANVASKESELLSLKDDLSAKDQAIEEAKAAAEKDVAEAKAQAEKDVAEAKAEAEEVAASGKEVIEHLNEQRDKQQAEIDKLEAQVKRLEEAEEANRKMAEEISALAAAAKEADSEGMDDLHADLEVTLSEVPGDDEVQARDGLSTDLANNSVAIIDKIRGQLSTQGDELQKVSAERDELKGLLRQSRAAIEEYRARNEESSSTTETEVKDLSDKLAAMEKSKADQARELQEQIDEYRLEENVLKKKVDELNKQLAARDDEILAIKRAEDSGADQQVELSTLEAQNKALEDELKQAKEKLQGFEDAQSALGDKESFSADALRGELTKLRQEREELRGRIRGVEDELATERSRVESLKEDRQNLRDEFGHERDQIMSDLEREKTAHGEDTHELKRLRSELAGAQAKIRALSESGDDQPPS